MIKIKIYININLKLINIKKVENKYLQKIYINKDRIVINGNKIYSKDN